MVNNEAKIVKNASQGYGYKYSSLADLAEAGVNIPKMRVKPTEYGEFIEYLDKNGEWQIGAKIIEFEAKGMNRAQMYGSALTYARRFSVMLAEQVACSDDKGVEESKPTASVKKPGWKSKPTEKQLALLAKLYQQGGLSKEDVEKYINIARDQSSAEVSKTIESAKQRLEQKKNEPTDEELEAFDE